MKSVELGKRMVLRKKLLKEKKLRLQQQTLVDNVKLILDAGKNVESLLVSELILSGHGTKSQRPRDQRKRTSWNNGRISSRRDSNLHSSSGELTMTTKAGSADVR